MRRTIALALLLLVFHLSAAAADWKPYSSFTGRFSVTVPGTPVPKTTSLDTALGRVDLVQFMVTEEGGVYMVAYCDYPAIMNLDEEALVTTADGMIKSVGGTIQDGQKISQDGYPGRLVRGQSPLFSVVAKVLWMKPRLYQLITVMPRNKPHSAEVDRFLSSFSAQAAPGSTAEPSVSAAVAPTPPAAPKGGSLNLVSQPGGAEVYLDDRRRGITDRKSVV